MSEREEPHYVCRSLPPLRLGSHWYEYEYG